MRARLTQSLECSRNRRPKFKPPSIQNWQIDYKIQPKQINKQRNQVLNKSIWKWVDG